jgi:GYF domain 2
MHSTQLPAQASPRETGAGEPPHPLDKRWYAHVDGKTYGPYTGHQIRQMVQQQKIVGSDLVYDEGEDGSAWQQIANHPVLGALFKGSEAPRSPLVPRLETSPRFRKWLLAIPVIAVVG